jgi:tetratricopeptide (TPR) repeat protein
LLPLHAPIRNMFDVCTPGMICIVERAIRVFVSSTFRDMHHEREELVKRIFPQLRRLCETRNVVWSEVDLRWGVTDEQKAEGAVLPICLAEIDRSRPYFIGLLGQRYGWVPDPLPPGLSDQLTWLNDLSGTSVTEIEILHGALNDDSAHDEVFFYLRDPAWLATRSDDERRLLQDDASDDAAADHRDRLTALRERVARSGLPCWEYPDPQALGQRVLADFTGLIDRLFPADDTPDPIGRDNAAHAAFAATQTQGHIVRQGPAAQLDDLIGRPTPPVIVAGEPGMDTAGVAIAWLQSWSGRHPDDVIVQHHVGANADSADWSSMAGRLVAELGIAHGFAADAATMPDDSGGRRGALFAAFDHAGRARRRSVIVVTGADLLTDVDGAPDLTWLPAAIGPDLRIVVATSGERAATEGLRRSWPIVQVPMLDDDEKRASITEFLARHAKGLDQVHVARLVAADATGNALFLRTMLDELRQHGDHYTLGDVIAHHLSAPTVDRLLELVLARYELDFERDRPGLVGNAMRAIWAARRGITEAELFDVLGSDHDRLPGAVWSPLVLAAEAGLVTRSGLLGFATEPHRQAVERRYLPSDHDRQRAHAALAQTFATYPLGPRVIDELPWQQFGAGDTDGMVATISDLRFTDIASRTAHADLKRLWARAADAGHRVIDAYRDVIDHPDQHSESTWAVARLVTDAGFPTEARRLNQALVEQYRGMNDPASVPRLIAALINHGAALWLQGDLDAADHTLHEAIALARPSSELGLLQAALGNLAVVRRDRGDQVAAIALFGEEEALCRRRGDTIGLQASLGNRSELLRQRGDTQAALALAQEQESLCRSIGDAMGVARALAGQGAILADSGDRVAALDRFRAHEQACRQAGDLRGLAESLISQIGTLRELGQGAEAVAAATQAEALTRQISDEPLLARVLDGQARSAADEGRWADADRLATEAALTARSAGATAALVLALSIGGIARRELGDLAGSRRTHEEEERAAAANNDPAAVATARVNLAAVDIASNDFGSALDRYASAEPVLRSMGLDMQLVPMLANRWQIHLQLGDAAAAIADLQSGARSAGVVGLAEQCVQLLTKAIELLYASGHSADAEPVWQNLEMACRATGDLAGLQRAIGERALLLVGRGDAAAGPMLDEQEAICRQIGDQVGLAACIGNRAILLRHSGDLAGALRCIDEQLNIATASGNRQGMLFATANRGDVLAVMGRVAEGSAALGEARAMAHAWGMAPLVAQLDQMMATMRAQQQ